MTGKDLRDLRGRIEFADGYDYKALRGIPSDQVDDGAQVISDDANVDAAVERILTKHKEAFKTLSE